MMDIVERLYANTDFSTSLNLGQESAQWNAYEDLRKASDEMIIELRAELAAVTKERDQFKGSVDSYMKAYDDCREEHTRTHAKLVEAEELCDGWRKEAVTLDKQIAELREAEIAVSALAKLGAGGKEMK